MEVENLRFTFPTRLVSGPFVSMLIQVLASIIHALPERARSGVLKAFKDLSSSLGANTRVNLGILPGLPKPLQDDLEQCCVAGESSEIN